MIIDEIKAAADSIVLEENRILLYLNGNITDTALVNSLSALKLGKQYAVVTQKGCDAVRIEKSLIYQALKNSFCGPLRIKTARAELILPTGYARTTAEKADFLMKFLMMLCEVKADGANGF